MIRIGLIARNETARGLSIQVREFFTHMPVDRVLLVQMPAHDDTVADDWYPNATVVRSLPGHTLDEPTVREWLSGLDVVFTAETPYDWRMPGWCKDMGVRLVIQGNPEFVRHRSPGFEQLQHPDAWWWPTSWRLDQLPSGEVMPVPADWNPFPVTPSDVLRVVHVVGKRAFADRNGTELLVQALRMVRSRVVVTVYGLDGQLPTFRRQHNIELRLVPNGVTDRWEMYQDQDVLLLPRRYGGLCLPAVEAASKGLVVVMPNCSPNAELAAVLTRAQRARTIHLACGPVLGVDADAAGVADAIDELAGSDLTDLRVKQRALLNTWDVWRPRYLDAMAALL